MELKKWKKLRTGGYDDVDQAVFKWFNSKRSQQIPIDWPMLKEKAIDFAKAINKPDFKGSDGWLTANKGRFYYNFFIFLSFE